MEYDVVKKGYMYLKKPANNSKLRLRVSFLYWYYLLLACLDVLSYLCTMALITCYYRLRDKTLHFVIKHLRTHPVIVF